jgi:predicted MFS family arabinose efflux permease
MSPGAASERSIAGDVWQAASAGGPWLLGGLMAAFAAVFFAVFGFLPAILAERLGVTPETGSLLTAAAVAANVVGNLACGPLLDRGVRRSAILIAAFAGMALCGFGILGGSVSGPLAYAACVAFSAVGGLIPVALLDGASRHAPRPELVGATVGFGGRRRCRRRPRMGCGAAADRSAGRYCRRAGLPAVDAAGRGGTAGE